MGQAEGPPPPRPAGIGDPTLLLKMTSPAGHSHCDIAKRRPSARETTVTVYVYKITILRLLFLGHVLKIAISVTLK